MLVTGNYMRIDIVLELFLLPFTVLYISILKEILRKIQSTEKILIKIIHITKFSLLGGGYLTYIVCLILAVQAYKRRV